MDIRFSGSRSGTAPLTWGQRAIWDAIRKTAPDDHYFNFGRVLAVPRRARPLTVARAAEVLGALVERHESLRTRMSAGMIVASPLAAVLLGRFGTKITI
ncbi:hypothetical protein ACFQ08_35170, partial [Streptosporangium algeriense]